MGCLWAVGSSSYCPRGFEHEHAASAATVAAVVGWRMAGSVAHLWGHRRGSVFSDAGAGVRGTVPVLAAEVGPWLRLWRLLRCSWGEVGVCLLYTSDAADDQSRV